MAAGGVVTVDAEAVGTATAVPVIIVTTETFIDGSADVGLLVKGGTASFDKVTAKTDDTQVPQSQVVASAAVMSGAKAAATLNDGGGVPARRRRVLDHLHSRRRRRDAGCRARTRSVAVRR